MRHEPAMLPGPQPQTRNELQAWVRAHLHLRPDVEAALLTAKDTTVSSISRYFEALVADLTDKSNRDPKTKLMNFARFNEQLESFLALEQRGRWCAIGLVDITGFKWYNDALGHTVGDRIIERVAALLREQVRSDDLLAQERPTGQPRSKDLH